MKTALKILLFIAMSGSLFTAFAQDTQSPNYKPSGVYNLKFVVSELEDGKITNQRVYTAVVREERKGMLKTGSRVPIVTGSKSGDSQIQYLDVGFNADFTISEREGRLDLDFSGDLSSMAPSDASSAAAVGVGAPVIRQVREAMNTSLVEGKPTVVASLDDVNSKKTVQLEVIVTRIKK